MFRYTIILYKPDGTPKAYDNVEAFEELEAYGQVRCLFITTLSSGKREVVYSNLPFILVRPEVA